MSMEIKDNLQELFKQKQLAYDNYQAVQMINIIGKTIEERIDIDVAAESARQKWFYYESEYLSAIEKYVKGEKQ